jgi:hypothetical protein
MKIDLVAHFERAMEKARFIEFRRCFNQERLAFVDGESKIDELYNNMVSSFPELDVNYELPELNLREDEVMDEDMEEVQPKPKKKRKDLEQIEKKLRESLNLERYMDYTTQIDLRMENENSCIETLRLLDKAECDARKRIVFFSSLKGQVMKRFKEITGKNMRSLLKITNYKQSHAYFLIKLHDLTDEYNKLMFSEASLCFFKNNIKEIKIICNKDEMFFK